MIYDMLMKKKVHIIFRNYDLIKIITNHTYLWSEIEIKFMCKIKKEPVKFPMK